MKNICLALFLVLSSVGAALADVYVNGYYRSNGTYVAPHYRSSPNSSVYDNWSTRGNTNPYTGKAGTRSPYGGSSSGFGNYGGSNDYGNGYNNGLFE